jgi:pyruvate formate lyase activating enzyme
MTEPEDTTVKSLMRAAEIGRQAGLHYIYAGNLPGNVGDLENTRCSDCRELLIERIGYRISQYRLTNEGCCPKCGKLIPGRWDTAFRKQISSHPYVPRLRVPTDLIGIS